MTADGCTCACCDGVHEGFPAIGFEAPDFWWDDMADAEGHELTSDTCVIPGVGFFVRAVLRIPVLDAVDDFEWGVWVSQSEASFRRPRPQTMTTPARRSAGCRTTSRDTEPPPSISRRWSIRRVATGARSWN
jgi:hypothetical protein